MSIPVSVIVMTKNEEAVIERCLTVLSDFDEIFVVDSGSTDRTVSLAEASGAKVVNFQWNGEYPKKKQWCLDNLPLNNDWIFHVDADEELTPELCEEIMAVFSGPAPRSHAGYFVRGYNVVNGRKLRFGQHNNKLALFNRQKMTFPPVDDLNIKGGNEVEGHYQPVIIPDISKGKAIGKFKCGLLHHIYESGEDWKTRHSRYASWERGMSLKKAWPEDPVPLRQALKEFLRGAPLRPYLVFIYGYIVKGGFLDGTAGFRFARDRYRYYKTIDGLS